MLRVKFTKGEKSLTAPEATQQIASQFDVSHLDNKTKSTGQRNLLEFRWASSKPAVMPVVKKVTNHLVPKLLG
jgi:hypothetical protein